MQVYRARMGDGILPLAYYLDNSKPIVPKVVPGADVPLDYHTTKLQGFSVFEAAEKDGCFQVLVSFLLAGVDPNAAQRDAVGATLLHLAARAGNILSIHFLVDNGADVNSTTRGGQTPLMWALAGNHADAVGLLLSKGADPNVQDSEGQSALSFACSSALAIHSLRTAVDTAAVAKKELLLHRLCRSQGNRFSALYCIEQLGVDVNQKDISGRTPLHYAALTGDIDLVKALCSKSADVNALDDKGFRPYSQPGVSKPVAKFLQRFDLETNQTARERLAVPDFSNLSRLTPSQAKHFAVAFFVPNIVLVIGSYFPLWVGFMALVACAVGFTMVAQFGMRQKGRSLATAGWFSGALFFGGSVVVRQVLPSYSLVRPESYVPLLWWAVTGVMYYCYARAVLADPGVVQSTADGRKWIYDVIGNGGEGEVASQGIDLTSMVKKPLRAKHCTKTGQCVYRFDHYCVWTGNSISGGNHRFFVVYCLFQFFSQFAVAYTTAVYLLIDGPERANIASYFSREYLSFLYSSENVLVTFFLVYYNTFVFLFVSTVLVTQVWYAARNVTSNEVWFAERYKWMFKLGSRAYCLFDQGWKKNLVEFFWSGNLCAEVHTIPPMNDYLKGVCQKFAARERSRQLNSAAHRRHADADEHLPLMSGPLGESSSLQVPVPQQSATQPHPAAANFDFQSAVAQLPDHVQKEMTIVQGMVQKMVAKGSVEGVEVPPSVPAERREHVLHQSRTMFQHFQAALQMNRQAAQRREESGAGDARVQLLPDATEDVGSHASADGSRGGAGSAVVDMGVTKRSTTGALRKAE